VKVRSNPAMVIVRLLGGISLRVDQPGRFQQYEFVECSRAAASGQQPDNGC